jgi:integrase/recombinase XerD
MEDALLAYNLMFIFLKHYGSKWTYCLAHGTNLLYIQELLGHTSSKTTEIYTHASKKTMDQKIDNEKQTFEHYFTVDIHDYIMRTE